MTTENQNPARQEVADRFAALLKEGKSSDEAAEQIGKEYDITEQQVRDIVAKHTAAVEPDPDPDGGKVA